MQRELESIALWSDVELRQKLEHGLSPNAVVNALLDIRLVHYWAKLGELNHLKVLREFSANFNAITRYGTTARDELISSGHRKSKPYTQKQLDCLDWLNHQLPQTPPSRDSSLSLHGSFDRSVSL